MSTESWDARNLIMEACLHHYSGAPEVFEDTPYGGGLYSISISNLRGRSILEIIIEEVGKDTLPQARH